jgi:membrane protein implicated in regulation of membrane protease activity
MGLAYLFALIVGLGILVVQSMMGTHGAHGGVDAHASLDAHADAHAALGSGSHAALGTHGSASEHAELHADAGVADAGATHGAGHPAPTAAHAAAHHRDTTFGTGLVALFLSTRFWIFAFLGFGLSGSILSYLFSNVSGLVTFATAVVAGVLSGLTASLSFRALQRTSSLPAANTSAAVGRVARVLVPCAKGSVGQVRILLDGQTVDLVAKTKELRIEKGEDVLIEEIDGEYAQVSKAPPEINQ